MARLVVARSGDMAWLVILGAAIMYEFMFEDLLTMSVDRFRSRHPLLTRFFILALAGHLAGLVPPEADIFHASNIAHRAIVSAGNRKPQVRFIASPLAILLLRFASRGIEKDT